MKAFRVIPSVEHLLTSDELRAQTSDLPRTITTQLVRDSLQVLRRRIAEGRVSDDLSRDDALSFVIEYCGKHWGSPGTTERLDLLCRCATGCAWSLVASSGLNALATVLSSQVVAVATAHLCQDQDEGRVLETLHNAGVTVIEAGCTNKIHEQDLEKLIAHQSCQALLAVENPPFKIIGFTKGVPIPTMAELTTSRGIPLVIHDMSGDLTEVERHLRQGAAIVTFPTHRALAGPMAGIAVGRDSTTRPPSHDALRKDDQIRAGVDQSLMRFLSQV